ncbi:uncharacterized protein LOC111411110 [Olea europaea var. sylvestris]|uniref:uncharacterized protein LOC111411110 n=1 Tax=Olea europaea var. sylvestris TaxID=158386 RepID=UPI000C1D6EEE|nr:uncharacterized protein LOC111411110 [Olea europaea var. sylvestris]
MKNGEFVTSYCAKTMEISNKMRFHGEKMEDVTIVEKILRSMTPISTLEDQAFKASTSTHFSNSKERARGRDKGRERGDLGNRDGSKSFKVNNDQFQGSTFYDQKMN